MVMVSLWALVLGVSSTAIEYGRALKVRSELQGAADAAVQVAARRATIGDPALSRSIRATLDARLRPDLKGMPFAYTIDPLTLDLRIEASVGTRLAALFGKPAFHFAITSSVDLTGGSFPAALARRNAAELQDPAMDLDETDAELTLDRGNATHVTVHAGATATN